MQVFLKNPETQISVFDGTNSKIRAKLNIAFWYSNCKPGTSKLGVTDLYNEKQVENLRIF